MVETRYKNPSRRSKFFVPAALWKHAISFCRCYPLWVAELAVCDTTKTITDYTRDKVQSSGDSNPTEKLALRRVELQKKIDIVESAAKELTDSESMQKYLVMGVTHQLSYETLEKQGIPCGRRMYHELRRGMIYIISLKIG